jgi:hypothetical protein
MRAAGESFYVSGGFWVAVVSVAVTIIAATLGMWITWRADNPKQRLLFGMPVSTRLINADGDVRQELEVRRDDQVLTDPHIVEITLLNQGRRDIASSVFDQGRPLVLDVGVAVLDILKVTTTSAHAVPITSVDGTSLRVGPDLIGRGQRIVFSLLVDGASPSLTCPPPHPINIDVGDQDEVLRRRDRVRQLVVPALGLVTVATILITAVIFNASRSHFNAAAQAKAVDLVLSLGRTSRESLNSALMDCNDLDTTVATLQTVAQHRQDALTSSRSLNLSQLTSGDDLKQQMIAAYQYSREADLAWIALAKDGKCLGEDNLSKNSTYQSGMAASAEAGQAKERLTALWNPIAEEYGLPTYSASDL